MTGRFRTGLARALRKAWRLAGVAFVALGLLIVPAAAQDIEQLEHKYKKFLNEDAVYIMLSAEEDRFLALTKNADKDRFIENFWRVRDPIPETLANEFKEEHLSRIKEANRLFREGRGWRSERGQMYIVLGPPQDRMQYPNTQQLYPVEVWQYTSLNIPRFPVAPRFMFFKRNGVGEFRLYSPVFDGMKALLADHQLRGAIGYGNRIPMFMRAEFDIEIMDAAEGIGPGYNSLASMEVLATVQKPGFTFEHLGRDFGERVSADVTFGGDLPVTFEVDYFRSDGDFSEVHLALEIRPEDLRVNQYDRDMRGRIDLFGTIRTSDGQLVEEFRDTAELKINEAEWDIAQHFPFLYQRKLHLLPGRYQLELLARDYVARGVATVRRMLSVPAFPSDRLSFSSPVIAFKADYVPLGPDQPSLPYTFGRLRLFPKTDNVIGAGQGALVFFEVYYPPEKFETEIEVSAHFNLKRGEEVVLEETNRYRPEIGTEGSVTILKFFPGTVITAGDYSLEIELSEPTTGYFDLSRVDFEVDAPQEMGRLTTVGLPEFRAEEKFFLDAHKYSLAGAYDKAMPRYQAALDYDPGFQDARLGKARTQIYSGDLKGGEVTAREAIERQPTNASGHIVLGLALFRQERYEEAAVSYRKSIELGVEGIELLNALGEAEYYSGKPQAAREALTRSLELEPNQDAVTKFLKVIDEAGHGDGQ